MKRNKWLRRVLVTAVVLFVVINTVAAIHAFKLTHYSRDVVQKTEMNDKGLWANFGLALTGVDNPRPENSILPGVPFETVIIESNVNTECWKIESDSSIGTVIICHGYGGSKSSMLDKANEFLAMNYSVLLVDFMGSGGSEGDQCTIGYFESEQVKSCYDYLVKEDENNIVLFGTSMGAVAIMKAISETDVQPRAIILECPFGSLYQTVCARFGMMNIPSFPMAELLTFWGGVENGFSSFDHVPAEYAMNIKCPVLLIYGERDPKVSREEIDAIYNNLPGPKQLVTYEEAGHENYLTNYSSKWKNSVAGFLNYDRMETEQK